MDDNTNHGPAPKMSQFEIDRFIGRGCWKEVWHGTRKSDSTEWALKPLRRSPIAVQQSIDRQLSVDDYWKKESLGGHNTAYSNIAFSYIDVADDGEKVQAEEYVDRFLSDYVKDTPNISLEEILHISKGMSKGLDDWHNKIKRVNADFKFDNVGYSTDGTVKITDKGASTIGESDISNIGFILTRSPENFSGQVTKSSDVWSFGSMLYAMLHPEHKYPLQDEHANNPNFGNFVSNLYEDRRAWNNAMDEKIDALDAPRYMRKLLRSTLHHEKDRLSHGGELHEAVITAEKGFKNDDPWIWAKKAYVGLAVVAAIGVGIAYSAEYVKDSKAKIKEEQEHAEWNRKWAVVRTYYSNDRAYNSDNILSMQALDGLNNYFNDKKTASLAYLYPDIAAKAFLMSGGAKSIDTLRPYVEKIDLGAMSLVDISTQNIYDNWMFSGMSGVMTRAVEDFNNLVEKFRHERDSTERAWEIQDSTTLARYETTGGQWGMAAKMVYEPKSVKYGATPKSIGK